MLVVVQTYPAHFYQTVLCLENIRCVGLTGPIMLFLDDISNLAWPSYHSAAYQVYQPLCDEIRLISDMPGMRRLRRWPWLRQQTHKLLLHGVIDQSEWLFVDGDVQLTALPSLEKVAGSQPTYSGVPLWERDPGPGEMSSQVLYYLKHMLGQEIDIMWADQARQKIWTASHPPIKIMSANVNRSLQQHIESKFAKDLVSIHLALAEDTRMAASEWDLIEYYRRQILHEQREWYEGPAFFKTTWSADKELGESWFRERGLEIDPEIWKSLPAEKYL